MLQAIILRVIQEFPPSYQSYQHYGKLKNNENQQATTANYQ